MSILRNWLKSSGFWLILVALICLMLLPFISSSRFILNMVSSIAIAAVFAVSYNLLAGFTGVFSLGHAVFFGSSAYILGIIMYRLGTSIWLFLLAILLSMIVAILLGLFVGYLALRLNPDFPLEKNFVQVSQHGGPEALAHRPQNQARFFLGTDNSKWFLPELFFHAPPTASTIPCSVESVC